MAATEVQCPPSTSSTSDANSEMGLNPYSPEFVPGQEEGREHSGRGKPPRTREHFSTRIFVNSNRKHFPPTNDSGAGQRGGPRRPRPFHSNSQQAPPPHRHYTPPQHDGSEAWNSGNAESQNQPWQPPPVRELPPQTDTNYHQDPRSSRRERGHKGGGGYRGGRNRGGGQRHPVDDPRGQDDQQSGVFGASREGTYRQNGEHDDRGRRGTSNRRSTRGAPRPPYNQRPRQEQGGEQTGNRYKKNSRSADKEDVPRSPDEAFTPPPGDYSPQDWRSKTSPPKKSDDAESSEQPNQAGGGTSSADLSQNPEELPKTEGGDLPARESEGPKSDDVEYQGQVTDWAREASTEDSSLQESHQEDVQNNTSQSLEDPGLHTSPEPDQESVGLPEPQLQTQVGDATESPSSDSKETAKDSPKTRKPKKSEPGQNRADKSEQQPQQKEDMRKNCRLQGKYSSQQGPPRPHKKVQYTPVQPSDTGFIYHSTGQTAPLDKPIEPELLKFQGEHTLSEHNGKASKLVYHPSLIPQSQAISLMETLLNEVKWEQRNVLIRGVPRPQPRKVAWFGPLPYGYTGLTLQPQEKVPQAVSVIQKIVEEATKSHFNSVLLNLYENGHHSVGWHSDDEMELGVHPCIASVSLGEVRRFELRRKPQHRGAEDSAAEPTHRILLENGSLIVMDGVMQAYWLHRVPKESHIKSPRINLTFRNVFETKH